MTYDANYLKVLPDYVSNSYVDDCDDAKVKSRDEPVTSLYERPQLSETTDGQHQRTHYQRVITSRRLPGNVTSDCTYDEIVDIPSPPPPRPVVGVNRGVPAVQQQQQQQLASSNIVYVQVPAGNARPPWNGRHYLRTQSICLGAVLVVVGCLSVIGNVVMAAFPSEWGRAWYLTRAILFASMFVVSGGFGIGAGVCKTKCMIVTFIVLCIVTTFSSLSQTLTAAIAIDCTGYHCGQFWVAMESVQLITSLTAAVACIWGSAIGCHGVCSCCYSNDDSHRTTQYVAGDVNMAAMQTLSTTATPQRVSPLPASAALVKVGGVS